MRNKGFRRITGRETARSAPRGPRSCKEVPERIRSIPGSLESQCPKNFLRNLPVLLPLTTQRETGTCLRRRVFESNKASCGNWEFSGEVTERGTLDPTSAYLNSLSADRGANMPGSGIFGQMGFTNKTRQAVWRACSHSNHP